MQIFITGIFLLIFALLSPSPTFASATATTLGIQAKGEQDSSSQVTEKMKSTPSMEIIIEQYWATLHEKLDSAVTWYESRNIEVSYLKGILKIRILDFFLLTFSFFLGAFVVVRYLIRS